MGGDAGVRLPDLFRFLGLLGHGPPELRECLVGLFVVLFCPNRQMIMSWNWRSDYLYAAAFAALAGTSLLQMSNPPPFIYFQF
jgi:hypothetical protein